MTPNGKVHRLLTRLSTDILFHPFQPFMIGQKLLASKMADLFKIPLVFFGSGIWKKDDWFGTDFF